MQTHGRNKPYTHNNTHDGLLGVITHPFLTEIVVYQTLCRSYGRDVWLDMRLAVFQKWITYPYPQLKHKIVRVLNDACLLCLI